MTDQAATALFLSPFALLWAAAFAIEAARAVAAIREGEQ